MRLSRQKNTKAYDVLVIGGGVVGTSIGYGLSLNGAHIAILDGHDKDFSASRGNFGMISVSNKGFNNIPYFHLSLASRKLWTDFAAEIHQQSGTNPHFDARGKVYMSLGDQELADRVTLIEDFTRRAGNEYHQEILGRDDLDNLLGGVGLGENVTGGAFSKLDGSVDPLKFYSGLLKAYRNLGGHYLPGHVVSGISRNTVEFSVETPSGTITAPKILIAAGLGTPSLASQVGLNVTVRPQRGQIIVTERVDHVFHYPISGFLRQNSEGTIMIGSSSEYVGFNDHTTVETLKSLAKNAVEKLPILKSVQINRCWAALRPRTDDGYLVMDLSTIDV